MQVFTVFLVVILSFFSGNSTLVKKEGDRFTDKAQVSFINFEVKKDVVKVSPFSPKFGEKGGKHIEIHHGRIVWNENSGWEGKPAQVPIQIFQKDDKNKRVIPMATYFPNPSGEFYFAVEKVKTEVNRLVGSPYILAAFPQRALKENVPKKVKKFFKEMNEDGDGRKGQGNKIH